LVAGLSLVSLLVLLDDTAVSVALPSIQRQLGFNFSALEWIVNAYTLAIAAFTLLAGHLADRRGARSIFLLGLAIFIAGSLVSGLASSVSLLIVSRSVQGLGAALIGPTSLSLIATAFPDHRRGTALGIWAGVSASALGIGPVIGALITDGLGWNWIFLLNVPLGIFAWFLARRILPRPPTPRPAGGLDLLGAALSGLVLLSLLLALNQAGASGWGAPEVIGLLMGSAVLLALFLIREQRTPSPIVDLSMFKNRLFTGANVVTLISTAVMCSLFFFLALYLQTIVGLSAVASGLTLLPLTLTIIVVSPIAGRLTDKLGAHLPIVVGMALLAAGLLGMSRLSVNANTSTLMLWLALTGLGIGIARTPTTATALGNTETNAYGTAAGVFNTSQATGLALGISLMGVILTSFRPQVAFLRETSASHHAAFLAGFSTALIVNAGLAAFASLFALIVLRPQQPAFQAPPRRG
jgi:EmrB/QacA subfamily drug resistance transporter